MEQRAALLNIFDGINKVNSSKKYDLQQLIDKEHNLLLVQNDIRKYLDMVEEKVLKFKAEEQIIKNNDIKEENKNEYLEILNYVTYSIIKMYTECEVEIKFGDTIKDEAEIVSEELVKAYIDGVNCKDFNLLDFIPIPENMKNKSGKFSIKQKFVQSKLKRKFNNVMEVVDFLVENEKYGALAGGYVKDYLNKNSNSSETGIIEYSSAIWNYIRQSCLDIKEFSKESNITYDVGGELRCLYNSFNLYLHYIIIFGRMRLTDKERKLIFAASAIHPVEDDFIDKEPVNEEVFNAVSRKLFGEKDVPLINEKCSPIYNLIDLIYSFYPADENPQLVTIFTELNYWQFKSMKQKDSFEFNELLKLSFMKGGYAFVLFGYMVLGEMSMKTFRHFFGMGAIFQLMDDLHDVEEDLQRNIFTICTRNIKKGKPIDEVVKGIAAAQKRLEAITPLAEDLKYPVLLRRLELLAVRYDVVRFSCMNRKHYSKQFMKQLELCLPVELNIVLKAFSNKIDKGEAQDFIDMLDKVKVLYEKYIKE